MALCTLQGILIILLKYAWTHLVTNTFNSPDPSTCTSLRRASFATAMVGIFLLSHARTLVDCLCK